MRFTRLPATSAAHTWHCRWSGCRRSRAERLTRVGLSATQKPIEEVGTLPDRRRDPTMNGCTIIDSGHVRARDLALELPPAPLEAVMSGEVWTQVYDRLAELVREHRTTLVFVNTRRLVERVARHLSESARRRKCRRASRQSIQGTAPACGAAPEARRAEGAGGDRVAGTRHRHRRCGPGLPDRLDALHQCLPAARGPRRPLGGRHLQGPAVSAVARRTGGVRGAAGRGAPRRIGSPGDSAKTPSTCWRSR